MPVRSLPEALYSADQTRELDRLAGEAGLSGEELMERAGRAAFDVLLSRWPDVSLWAVAGEVEAEVGTAAAAGVTLPAV